MAVIGSLQVVRAQLADIKGFDVALAYVARCFDAGSTDHSRVAAMAEGANEKVELGDGVFAIEMCYLTKPDSEMTWESHRIYADVQVIFSGEEFMELTDTGDLELLEDLTPDKDVVLYKPFADFSRLRAGAGFVGVFFPDDAHRPSLRIDEPVTVKKMVVKVPLD